AKGLAPLAGFSPSYRPGGSARNLQSREAARAPCATAPFRKQWRDCRSTRRFAALDPGAKRLFPQVAAGRELQERRDARTRQGDAMLAGKAAVRRGPRRGGDERRGKTGETVLRGETQHRGIF